MAADRITVQQTEPSRTERRWATEIPVRADLRALSRFPHADYADTFEIAVTQGRRTAEQWARAVFEGAPARMRVVVSFCWRVLGVQLAPAKVAGHVQGWRIVKNSTDVVVLQARSPAGLTARLVLQADASVLRFATFVRCDGLIGRAAWFGVAPVHRLIVSRLLGEATP